MTADRAIALDLFHRAILQKLIQPKNVVKDDWRKADVTDLLTLLQAEVRELVEAHAAGDDIEISWEAVDVAAFAFFLWDSVNKGVKPAPTYFADLMGDGNPICCVGDREGAAKVLADHVAAELEVLHDGDEFSLVVTRKDMSRADVEALPEI
jgi:NTP pyrophosphatase (non-canonical NTP hydrolase)